MKITDQTDEQLLHHYIQSNELQYYTHIFNRYNELIFGVCYMYLNDLQQTQQMVISLKNKLVKDIKFASTSKINNWLYNYIRKECLNYLEEHHIPIPESLLEPIPAQENDTLFDPNASLENLINCLETLPENQQLVIKLFFIKEMTIAEIEKATGIESYKIKVYLNKGRKNLKACMLQYQSNN